MNIIRKIRDTIEKYSMFTRNVHILIGLSGGPDSVCLCWILSKGLKDLKLKISAVYIDHGLRPEDREKEIAFCKNISEYLEIDFFVRSLKTPLQKDGQKSHNLHDRLRRLRYAEYYKLAFELRADRIALGHNRNDQTETIIMNFLRGSGKTGLSGIPPVNGNIIRPLIDVKRKEIESFLANEKIDFIVDPTNKKDIYFRNRIRQSLIPQLEQLNPSLTDSLSHCAEIYRDEDDYLERVVAQELEQILFERDSNTIELLLSPLNNTDKAIQRRIIRRAFESLSGLKGKSFKHIESIINLSEKGKPGDSLNLPDDIRVVKSYSILKFTSHKSKKLSDYSLHVPGSVCLKEASFKINADFVERGGADGDGKKSALFPAELLANPLTIRCRKRGDFFYPFGFGRKKKLQDFFVDKKIPRDERDSIALVTSGEDIIWVVGYRTDDRFRIRSHTKKCVFLTIEPFESTPSAIDSDFHWKI